MSHHVKSPGPVEQALAQSNDPRLQRLCQMSNLELLDYMDELSKAGEDLDEELYDVATQLLDERAPIEQPSVEEIAQSWERFKAKCPEFFPAPTDLQATPIPRGS